MKRRQFITLLGGALSVSLGISSAAQEGITGQATINGIKASTRISKEMTAKVRAAT